VIERVLDDAREWARGRSWPPRALLLAWLAWILVRHLGDPVWYQSLWKPLDLGIHEAGHVLFRPFGETLCAAGGSIFQCMAPLLAAIMFARQRDYFAIAVCAGWLGENLFDVAAYMGDALAQELPLVTPLGGGEPVHDWAFVFDRLGVLSHCGGIALLVRVFAVLFMLLSLGAGAWLCAMMARSGPRAVDEE
jgi:hypothetical protein